MKLLPHLTAEPSRVSDTLNACCHFLAAIPGIRLMASVLAFLVIATAANAASDCDVTLIKAEKVTIEANKVTIVAEATATVIVIIAERKEGYKGMKFKGRPATQFTIASPKATFVIRQPKGAEPNGPLASAWKETLDNAKALQEGKEVGRIGYYEPTVVIKENLMDSIDGPAFLYSKGN